MYGKSKSQQQALKYQLIRSEQDAYSPVGDSGRLLERGEAILID